MDFSQQAQCLNCHSSLAGDYCSTCGQQKAERITFKKLVLIIQRGLFEFKSPVFRNLIDLTIRPAQACREYIEGKRSKYFNPVRYSFWLLTLSILIATLLDVDIVSASVDAFGSLPKDDTTGELVKSILRNGIVYFFYVFAFFMAMSVRLFFPKNKYNVWELYLTLLFINGHMLLVTITLILVGVYAEPWAQYGYFALSLLYPMLVIARMYTTPKKSRYFKAFASVVVGWFLGSLIFGFAVGVTSGYQHELEKNATPDTTEQIQSHHQ